MSCVVNLNKKINDIFVNYKKIYIYNFDNYCQVLDGEVIRVDTIVFWTFFPQHKLRTGSVVEQHVHGTLIG